MSHIDLEMRPTACPSRATLLATDRTVSALPARVAHWQSPTAQALHSVVETMFTWIQRARMRRRLLTLDDRMLKDIGVTRAEVHGEAEKPFWRV